MAPKVRGKQFARPVPPSAEPAASRKLDRDRVAELVGRLGRGKDLRKPITWPGGSWSLELEVLSAGQRKEADAAAASLMRTRYAPDDQTLVADLVEAKGYERLVQYVWRALIDPETDGRAFETPDELDSIATEAELLALWDAYCEHRDSIDPDPESLGDETFEALVVAIKKKDQSLWSRIASGLPRSSLLILVDRLASSWTDSSSSTQSSAETSTDELDETPSVEGA